MGTTTHYGWPRPTLAEPADIEQVGLALDGIDDDLHGTNTLTSLSSSLITFSTFGATASRSAALYRFGNQLRVQLSYTWPSDVDAGLPGWTTLATLDPSLVPATAGAVYGFGVYQGTSWNTQTQYARIQMVERAVQLGTGALGSAGLRSLLVSCSTWLV